jgi:hypothetical protein
MAVEMRIISLLPSGSFFTRRNIKNAKTSANNDPIVINNIASIKLYLHAFNLVNTLQNFICKLQILYEIIMIHESLSFYLISQTIAKTFPPLPVNPNVLTLDFSYSSVVKYTFGISC